MRIGQADTRALALTAAGLAAAIAWRAMRSSSNAYNFSGKSILITGGHAVWDSCSHVSSQPRAHASR
jgi:hypothetical protein